MTSQACFIRLECGCLTVWSRLGPSSAARLVGVDGRLCARAEPLSRRPHTGCAQVELRKSFPTADDEGDNDDADDTNAGHTYPPPRLRPMHSFSIS